MLTREQLKNVLHAKGLNRKQQVLICLGVEPLAARTVAELKSVATGAGLNAARKWNVSSTLSSLKGLAIRGPTGWELTSAGSAEVARLAGHAISPPQASSLRKLMAKISSSDLKDFIAEAIGSVEAHHYRSAVVLTWVGAVAALYDYVVDNELAAFNAEAIRRDQKWKVAKTADDLSRMKEHEFLQVLESISVIGKNVKTELEGCLKLRNGCGHPNSLKIAEHRVNSHIETLVLNVYLKFI